MVRVSIWSMLCCCLVLGSCSSPLSPSQLAPTQIDSSGSATRLNQRAIDIPLADRVTLQEDVTIGLTGVVATGVVGGVSEPVLIEEPRHGNGFGRDGAKKK